MMVKNKSIIESKFSIMALLGIHKNKFSMTVIQPSQKIHTYYVA